jgi:hypothetical protein
VQIKPQTHRWYSKTFSGWCEIFNVTLDDQENSIIYSYKFDNPERDNLIKSINEASIRPINLIPQVVANAFNSHYNPNLDLIMATINDLGHGTIYAKKDNDYINTSF